jgi:hypothetical protein
MDENEKTHNKHSNEIDEKGTADKIANVTLGDELLEREFKRQQAARDLVAKFKLDKTKSNQDE